MRYAAAFAIADLGEVAQGAVEPLFERLAQQSDYYTMRNILLDIRPRQVDFLRERLLQQEKSGTANVYKVRRTACDCLRKLGADAREALADLEAVVADDDVIDRARGRNDQGLLRCAKKALEKLRTDPD